MNKDKSDFALNDTQYRVEINENTRVIDLDAVATGDRDNFSLKHIHGDSWSILFRGKSMSATLTARDRNILSFSLGGVMYICRITNRRAQLLEDLGVSSDTNSHGGDVLSPMPGIVVKLHVAQGDVVSAGDALVVLEAMKMENEIRAPFDANVTGILAQPGESVPKDATLITLEHV